MFIEANEPKQASRDGRPGRYAPDGTRKGAGMGRPATPASWLLSVLLAVGCGEGSAAGGESEVTPPGEAVDADIAERWRSGDGVVGNPGVAGLLTLNEYDWGCCTSGYLGVIQLDLGTGVKRKFLDGADPSRHASGSTSFWQSCGTGVNRVALADSRGLIRVVTECSATIPNSGDSPTRFGFSRLSPDGQWLAVEVVYDVYFNPTRSSIRVYDLEGTVLAEYVDRWAPAWTPDGRLLMAGQGFYLTGADLSEPRRIDEEQLQGSVNNPCVHPSGDRIVFEYNQQIWEMALDGTELRERVSGGARLRYPTYSPDGRYIAYLSTPEEDYYDRAIYFTDLELDEGYLFDVTNTIGNLGLQVSVVPNGPLSWTEGDP
jgi:hypothetical protein